MPTVAIVALLFVAAGLLVLGAVGLGRSWCGPVSARDTALMAVMTGIAVGFLLLVMPVMPLLLFPAAVGAILVGAWAVGRRWVPLGAFLLGSGGFWAVSQAWAYLNDLADGAVSIPGWTPVPLALSVAAAVFGVALLIAGRETAEPVA